MIWTSASFNYYMLNLQVKHFPGKTTTNVMVLMGADIPASILAGYLFSRYKARTLFTIFYSIQSLAGLSILMLTFFGNIHGTTVFSILVAIARFGDTSCYAGIWIAHPRMFPTLFAVTSMGIASCVSRGFVVLAPMVAEFAFPIPIIVFVCLTTASGLSSLFLIERDVEELPKANNDHQPELEDDKARLLEDDDLELKKGKAL